MAKTRNLVEIIHVYDDRTADVLQVNNTPGAVFTKTLVDSVVRKSEPPRKTPQSCRSLRKQTRYTYEDKMELIRLKDMRLSGRVVAERLDRGGDGSQINKYYKAHCEGQDIFHPDFRLN